LKGLKQENSMNEIIRVDAADESVIVLNKQGQLYAWGKNDRGQLGTGAGLGLEYAESQRYPEIVKTPNNRIITDYCMGENSLMFKDSVNNIFRSGLKVSYEPLILDINRDINVKKIFCGSTFFSIISGKFNNNIVKVLKFR